MYIYIHNIYIYISLYIYTYDSMYICMHLYTYIECLVMPLSSYQSIYFPGSIGWNLWTTCCKKCKYVGTQHSLNRPWDCRVWSSLVFTRISELSTFDPYPPYPWCRCIKTEYKLHRLFFGAGYSRGMRLHGGIEGRSREQSNLQCGIGGTCGLCWVDMDITCVTEVWRQHER